VLSICRACCLRCSNQVHDDGSSEPEGCQHEPGEEDSEGIV